MYGKNNLPILQSYVINSIIHVSVQVALLRCNHDLCGKNLSSNSNSEQRTAGLQDATPEEKAFILHHNNLYKQKFGFPFIICNRRNKIGDIMKAFSVRLANCRDIEITNAIEAIKGIAYLRLCDIVVEAAI